MDRGGHILSVAGRIIGTIVKGLLIKRVSWSVVLFLLPAIIRLVTNPNGGVRSGNQRDPIWIRWSVHSRPYQLG